jgi:hypothetical protein
MAGVLAVAAFAFAAPSFAQQEDPAASPAPQAPAPPTKTKPGTVAYCQTLKGSSQRTSCLKKVHAQATAKATPTTAAKKATKKPSITPVAAKPVPDAAQAVPPMAPPAATAAAPTPTGPVAVPPLPQKTI